MCRVLAYLGQPISLGARAVRDRQLARPPVLQPADDGDVPQPRRLRHGRVGPALGAGRGSVRLPGDDAAGLRPQPPQPRRQARPDLPDRARPRRHPQRARDGRRDEPAPVPLPRRRRRAGAQRPPARVRAHALRPDRAHPAGAGPADPGDDGLRVDLRARALAARGPVRHAGDARARRRHGRRAAPPARRPGAARDRHLLAGEPVPRHGRGARRHALLVRLRLVPRRGRAARDRPAVREPVVHGRRRVRAARRRVRRWAPATPRGPC